MQLVRDRCRCGTRLRAVGHRDKTRAAWGAFSLLLAACCDCEERAAELSAAFAFASAAAAQGRLVLASAPSLPPDLGDPASYGGGAEADLDKTADGLASLAGVLAARMSAAARLARGPGDQAACQEAATQAAQIHELLARTMMTAATFGDVLGPARRHLDAATGLTGSIADQESITMAAAMTGRLAMTLSRYLADVAPYDMAEVITNGELSAQMRAAVQAREALQLAADGLRTGTRDQDSPGPDLAGPLAGHLAAAAAALAAGRDLLRSHATTGPDGHWEPRSRWATVIGSGPVSRALASEVALCSKPLTLLTAWLSVAAQADAATPALIRQGLAAASPLLLTATTTLTAAQHEHPATVLDAELLHAVPVHHLPQPRPFL